jgi:glycosyltransferase involved in cell wall biosynthesis
MKVLITAPSLDTTNNVSGISSVVNNIINHSSCTFKHFLVGRKDNEKAGFNWILKQIVLIFKFPFSLKGIDIVHINTALNPLSIFRDFTFVFIAKIFFKKVLLHLHGGKYLMEDCKNLFVAMFIKLNVKLSNYILVLSPIEETRIKSLFPQKRVSFLVNAIPEEKIAAHSEQKQFNMPLHLTFLGRIHESKGVEDIVSAMQILTDSGIVDFNFSLYGKGPQADFMIENLKKILGNRFEFKGVVGGEDKWTALKNSDIFLLPSRYGEGLPMAMLEAMAVGNIIITTDDASITYAVKDKINGFIVKKQNPIEIAELIRHLITNSNTLKLISENAVNTILMDFNIKNYICQLENIYSSA